MAKKHKHLSRPRSLREALALVLALISSRLRFARSIAYTANSQFPTRKTPRRRKKNNEFCKIAEALKKIQIFPSLYLPTARSSTKKMFERIAQTPTLSPPSLDAGEEQTFRKINRQHTDISIEKPVSGLAAFKNAFVRQIWRAFFLFGGSNTDTEKTAAIIRQ
jgi:hypothetical protein